MQNNSARPFRYEEKSVEDDFELVNVVSRNGGTNRKSMPPQINREPSPQQYNGILSTATNRLSLNLTSPVVLDSSDRNVDINNNIENRQNIESSAVEYNFRPDFEKDYIKRTAELMKKEEEEDKTRKAKFIAMLEDLNSTKQSVNTITNKDTIPQNSTNVSPSFPSLTQSINQLVNIPFSTQTETVNNNTRTPQSYNNNNNNGVSSSNNYNIAPTNYSQSSYTQPSFKPTDSYQAQPTYTAIPTMNQNPMLGFSTEEEVECYYNVLEIYKYPGFSTELARFATEAYRGDQLKVFDFCDKYRQLAEMHFSDKDIKEVLLLTDRSFEQSLDMLVNQKSPQIHSPQVNKYTTM